MSDEGGWIITANKQYFCHDGKDGRPDSNNIMTVKADRFTIEHHSLNAKDQIKPSKGNLQVFSSQDFEGLGQE